MADQTVGRLSIRVKIKTPGWVSGIVEDKRKEIENMSPRKVNELSK